MILENYPRRSSALFWTGLELQDQTSTTFVKRFRYLFALSQPTVRQSNMFLLFFCWTGLEIMLKFKISRFPTSTANRELCTTKSDRLGDKTRPRLSPKALTRRIPSEKHVFPFGNHRREKGNSKNPFSFLFSSVVNQDINLLFPAGDPNVIGSNNRINDSPPNYLKNETRFYIHTPFCWYSFNV